MQSNYTVYVSAFLKEIENDLKKILAFSGGIHNVDQHRDDTQVLLSIWLILTPVFIGSLGEKSP